MQKLLEDMVEKRRKACAEAQLKERVDEEKERRLRDLHNSYLQDRDEVEAKVCF